MKHMENNFGKISIANLDKTHMYILIGGLNIADFIQKSPIPKVYFLPIFHLMQYCHYLMESFIVDSYSYLAWFPKLKKVVQKGK